MKDVERVKMLCKERGISVAKLERTLGFANGYIGQLKKGFPADRLQKIADYFEVTTEYLLTGENKSYYINDETAKVAQEIFENRDLRALFDVQRDMTPEDLRALHAMALALKRKDES